MSDNWLPKGKHWGLSITHHPTEDAGSFVKAAPKLLLHTTEGIDFKTMKRVLIGKRAEPHLLVGHGGVSVCQFIPFNQAARALEHHGDPETNRAHCIQIEYCGYASEMSKISDKVLAHLGALAVLIQHRVPFKRHAPAKFTTTPHRLSGSDWLSANGILGHQHVPNQWAGHWDPGAFPVDKLIKAMSAAEKKYGGK
jgi:hypothetical protein